MTDWKRQKEGPQPHQGNAQENWFDYLLIGCDLDFDK